MTNDRIPADILEILRDNAAATEAEGRLAPASLDALRTAGYFSLAGTADAAEDPRAVVSIVSQIGAACPASAWIVALTTAVSGLLPLASKAAVTAVTDAAGPVVENFAPGSLRVSDHGFVLNGTWPYSSGSEVATYAMLAALQTEAGRPPRMRVAVVPTADLRVIRTWDVAGLQGTGSHTLVAEDVDVPADYVFDLPTDPDVAGLAVLRTTTFTSAALIGMATGALDVVTALLSGEKGPTRTRYTSFSDSPGARALYASAASRISNAAASVAAVADALAQHPDAHAADALDRLARLELRHSLVAAVREARYAVDDLGDLHGSSAFTRSNPLQRFWRDLGVGSRHLGLRGYIVDEDLARALVGRDDFAAAIS
ncbi:hypothetical protein [Herbiconiux solani]|uniref:hypothetical protein n=1 Tax=Herbiconiux solani TaxID=661329 RepID=UPI000825569B|nr:hypothetical protein [Herbiconiux solani]